MLKINDGTKMMFCFFCKIPIVKLKGRNGDCLVIHHINGVHEDNRHENRATVHRRCHTKHHQIGLPKPKSERHKSKISESLKLWYKLNPHIEIPKTYRLIMPHVNHAQIINTYFETKTMLATARHVDCSYKTVWNHLSNHNASIKSLGECQKCFNVNSSFSKILILIPKAGKPTISENILHVKLEKYYFANNCNVF